MIKEWNYTTLLQIISYCAEAIYVHKQKFSYFMQNCIWFGWLLKENEKKKRKEKGGKEKGGTQKSKPLQCFLLKSK